MSAGSDSRWPARHCLLVGVFPPTHLENELSMKTECVKMHSEVRFLC